MILGCSALLFGVLAVPLFALSTVDFPSFDLFGGDNETRTTSTTLAPLPASQCAALRSVRDAGNAAFDATFDGALGAVWSVDRANTDVLLARYEFTLQSARANVPAQFGDDLSQVADFVHEGRRILAASPAREEYRNRVMSDVMSGFSSLTDIEERLGSACGKQFTFWPHDGVELITD